MKKLVIALVLALMVAPAAQAIPHLQLYIEGATYDTDLDSWVTTESNFKLWVIGNVGADGTIFDVKLAASMYGTSGSISIASSTANGIVDPSTPGAPISLGMDETQFQSGGANYSPAFTPVSHHAEYADADFHEFWRIGDFDKTDSPIGDFQLGYPGSFPSTGQINAYDVSVSGWGPVHWDAFDHTVHSVTQKNHYWFVPPSHDATAVPEPGTLALLGMGLLGAATGLRRRKSS